MLQRRALDGSSVVETLLVYTEEFALALGLRPGQRCLVRGVQFVAREHSLGDLTPTVDDLEEEPALAVFLRWEPAMPRIRNEEPNVTSLRHMR